MERLLHWEPLARIYLRQENLRYNKKELLTLSVGRSSARGCQKARVVIAVLGASGPELPSHNPEVGGSSPSPATTRMYAHTGWKPAAGMGVCL